MKKRKKLIRLLLKKHRKDYTWVKPFWIRLPEKNEG